MFLTNESKFKLEAPREDVRIFGTELPVPIYITEVILKKRMYHSTGFRRERIFHQYSYGDVRVRKDEPNVCFQAHVEKMSRPAYSIRTLLTERKRMGLDTIILIAPRCDVKIGSLLYLLKLNQKNLLKFRIRLSPHDSNHRYVYSVLDKRIVDYGDYVYFGNDFYRDVDYLVTGGKIKFKYIETLKVV